jgi:hypothetical protein
VQKKFLHNCPQDILACQLLSRVSKGQRDFKSAVSKVLRQRGQRLRLFDRSLERFIKQRIA